MTYSGYNNLINGSSDMDVVYGIVGLIVVVTAVALLLGIIFKIITRWIFFKKCGEDGWKALIPVYTDITLFKISGLNWWWILLLYTYIVTTTIRTTLSITREFDIVTDIEFTLAILALFNFAAAIAALFARINLSYNISKKFNKDAGYTALILFFEPIMFLVLGLSKSLEYDESAEVSPNGIFGSQPASKQNSKFCSNCGNKVNKNEEYCGNCGKKMRK